MLAADELTIERAQLEGLVCDRIALDGENQPVGMPAIDFERRESLAKAAGPGEEVDDGDEVMFLASSTCQRRISLGQDSVIPTSFVDAPSTP